MASSKRIYVVKPANGEGDERLVEASNKTQAVGFVARNHFKANLASQAELVELVTAGVKVEKAVEEQEPAAS